MKMKTKHEQTVSEVTMPKGGSQETQETNSKIKTKERAGTPSRKVHKLKK